MRQLLILRIIKMKKISKLILVLALISFVLPNVTYAISLNPLAWDWGNKCAGFFTPCLSGAGQVTGATQNVPTSGSGVIYQGGTGIGGLYGWALVILRLVFRLIVSVAVVWFVYNVFQYTIRESEKDKEEVKTQIVWGIVGIFIMVSVWGLVNILQSTFDFNNTNIKAPRIQTSIN